MNDIALTFLVIAAVIGLFTWNRLPVVLVALATPLALYFLGILTLDQSLAGFGDSTVLFIAALFVVSASLDETGVTAWAGQLLITHTGPSRTSLLLLITALVSALTALVSVNGAVAALLPMVVVIASRVKRPPSKFLMPLVFSAHAGSLLTLTGSPVNVLISNAALKSTGSPFRYFEFAFVGIPLLLGTAAIIVFFGDRLLPQRRSRTISRDLSQHAHTLMEQYALDDGTFRLRVRPHSPYIGRSPGTLNLDQYPGISLVAIQEGDERRPLKRSTLAGGDILIVRGDAAAAGSLASDKVLAFRSEQAAADVADALLNRRSGLGELVIPPRSGLIGTTAFPGMITPSGDLIVLAVQRRGENQQGETVLEPGDTLLLQGTWQALDENLDDPDVLVVDSPAMVRRQAVPLGMGARTAIVILGGMILAMATNLVPAVIAALAAAWLLILLGVLTVPQAYRSVNWTTIILVGAMMPLSTAITETGAARMLGDGIVSLAGNYSPYALLAGLFILTAFLGQVISNMATALIIIPIAVAAATQTGVSPQPVLMSVAVAAAASFLTPIATPVNLMVKGPGGYEFGDYWKFGLPMLAWFFIVATFVVPIFWRF